MPLFRCPFNGCEDTTDNEDKDIAIAIAIFNAHVATHTSGSQSGKKSTRSERIARPKISQGLLEEG